MSINYFEHKESIAANLTMYIRLKGYSKLSFSKLTGISRPTIDQILKSESPNQTTYNDQINRINESLGLEKEYFLVEQSIALPSSQTSYAYSDRGTSKDRNKSAQELLDGLDNVLDIYSMYLK